MSDQKKLSDLEFTRAEKFSYKLIENVERDERIKKTAMNHIVSYYKYKHRGSEKAKRLFRNTHSNTLS